MKTKAKDNKKTKVTNKEVKDKDAKKKGLKEVNHQNITKIVEDDVFKDITNELKPSKK